MCEFLEIMVNTKGLNYQSGLYWARTSDLLRVMETR